MSYKNPADQREYQRKWRAARRHEYFKDKVCAKCGATEDLELDHTDRTKKIAHAIWSWTAWKRELELAKCQVLCKKCHWEKTFTELGYGPQNHIHGTNTRYRDGCRCEECRKAHKDARRPPG